MNPKTTAVVLIEYQNDFATEGGIFHNAVKEVMHANRMLPNTVKVVTEAREAGATIVHVPISFSGDYHEITPNPYGILKGVVDNKAFRKGTWGVEIIDELKPRTEDIVIEGKRGLCGFQLTNCCVESTMRSAYERGFEVITLTDCTAATSKKEQDAALDCDFGMFSHPMTHAKFIEQLSAVTV